MGPALAVVAFVLAVTLISVIRIASEHERFVVYRLGRFAGLRGPGLTLKASLERWQRVAVGARGEALSKDVGRIGEAEVPIESTDEIRPGSSIRVVGFSPDRARVALDFVESRTVVCRRCGHPNEI